MKKISLLIDKIEFKKKPIDYEIAQIKQRFNNVECIKELTIEELFDYIKTGHTFIPAVLKGGTKNENWVQQQLVAIDVDNKEKIIPPKEAVLLFKQHKINVLGYYHTFNSTEELPRYRLLFLLDEVITEPNKMKFIVETLNAFIHGDTACKDLSRMFYSTNGEQQDVVILDTEATITLNDVINLKNSTSVPKKYDDKELSSLIEDFDLLEYMKQDNEILVISGDRVDFKTCSICGHQNCLKYYFNTNTFYCFGSSGSKGGSIIDYLMATKNMNKTEAINYFKYDLMGLPKNDIKKAKVDTSYLSVVQSQIAKLGYEKEFVNEANFDWVMQSKSGKDYINCPNLYHFIAHNVPYIFANEDEKSGILRFVFKNGYYRLTSNDSMKGTIKQFIPLSLQKSKDINEVFNLLCTDDKFVSIQELNNDENIIIFNNGVLHLDTGILEKHSPKYKTTIKIPCNYNPDITAPSTGYFDNYIKSLTNNDEKVERLLLQFSGVALSNVKGYRMKKALILVGKGNSGKSVFKNFLTKLIGSKNCSNIDLERMEDRFGRMNIFNKRLVGSNDMSFAKIKQLEVFKQAVAGDPIYAEYKGENGINFIFNGVMWFCCNELPLFGGDKGSHVYDRFVIIKCDNVIPEEQRDKELVEHLLEEKEYIVSLMVKSLLQVIANNYRYDIPESSKKLLEDYKTKNSSFRTFLEECCVRRSGSTIKDNCTKGKIYKIYKEWYLSSYNNHYMDSKSEVKKILEEMGLSATINAQKGNEFYTYITLKEDVQREYYSILGGIINGEVEEIPVTPIIEHLEGIDDDTLNF